MSLGFVKSAFLDAALEVFHQHHALAGQDVAYCVGGLCTGVNPIQSTFEIQCDCGGIGVGVVRTNSLNESTISWCSAVGDNNRIERIVLATMALQSDFVAIKRCFVKCYV